MKVILSAVGSRDPYNDGTSHTGYDPKIGIPPGAPQIEGPVLTFFTLISRTRYWEPGENDRIYLVATQRNRSVTFPTYDRAVWTATELHNRYHVDVEVRNIPRGVNPAITDEVFPAMQRIVRTIMSETALPAQDPPEMLVNASPGTPQMRIAWYSLRHGGILPCRLWEVLRGTPPGLHETQLLPLFAAERYRLLPFLLRKCLFEEAVRELEDLLRTCPAGAAQEIRLAVHLCRGFHEWHEGRLGGARSSLKAANRIAAHLPVRHAGVRGIRELLESLLFFLGGRLNQQKQALNDYYEAVRRLDAGDYAGAETAAIRVVPARGARPSTRSGPYSASVAVRDAKTRLETHFSLRLSPRGDPGLTPPNLEKAVKLLSRLLR